MNFIVDKENNKIKVDREFRAPRDLVWQAWTTSEILDQWWAPKPWKANTKTMDFREGGFWHYCMEGPEGEQHWGRADYVKIKAEEFFSAWDGFCDDQAQLNPDLPRNLWETSFRAMGDATLVEIEMSFDSLNDLEATIQMGFKEGFTAGLENLDQYISERFRLRKEAKTSHKARVSSYLNFPGNTEEAFLFYQKVFRADLNQIGLQRFGDAPLPADVPPLDEAQKKLILHAELTILGGHVLMATDAPESMGFSLIHGNNMHINLEPESMEESQRIFDELSEGGVVEMPFQPMFWGAHFGSFKDRHGINWMINFQP